MTQGSLSSLPKVLGEDVFIFQAPFRPPTGPWEKLPPARVRWVIQRLAGQRETLHRAAALIVAEIEDGQGQRFEMSSRRLGHLLGMSQSTGSRCLRDLRRLGILALWRKHTVKYYPFLKRWIGKAAVHEVDPKYQVRAMTHPYRDERDPVPIGVSHSLSPGNMG